MAKDFEVLAAVDLTTREVYFISSTRITRNLFNIRLSETKNSQKKGIHFACDFMNFD